VYPILKKSTQLKIYNSFRQFPGSHTWQYWREHLADSLTFVGEQFKSAEIAYGDRATNLGINHNKNTQNH
jgi:hypothetical protein